MEIELICPNIYHIKILDRKERASAMIRFQEHYESPYPDIRGQIFTLGQVLSKGSRSAKGANTYCGGNILDSDWSGYNWPSYILDPFVRGLFDPLTPHEQDIVNTFKRNTSRFYVICTDGEAALEHEIMHGLFYTQLDYKRKVSKILSKVKLDPLKKYLKSIGYDDSVMLDECQAYLGADFEWICEKVPAMSKYTKESKAIYTLFKQYRSKKR